MQVLTTATSHGMSCGDIMTIAKARPRWWQLVALWRWWRKPVDTFVVTEVTATTMTMKIDPIRQVCCVTYAEGDRMLKMNEGWRLAPEEDTNKNIGMVYLERFI